MTDAINIARSVWIIDDDPISRLLIKKTLERANKYDVYREFADGAEFIKILSRNDNMRFDEPDLILLDINMPEKDGWEVLEFIKEKSISFDKSKVVLLSSSINPKDKIRAFSYSSIKGYLQKPLDTDGLNSLNL